MRIALCQYNPIVGDIETNSRRMCRMLDQARSAGAELAVFHELSLVGYPPRDLLAKDGFVSQNRQAVEQLAGHCKDIAALVGFVGENPEQVGRPLINAAALLAQGRVAHVHAKTLLPTYDVFDETRYFQPGSQPGVIEFKGWKLGISVCEDLWDAESLGRALYQDDPIGRLIDAGADVVINMAASPFHMGKAATREKLFARQARRARAGIVYVNQVGGNDELVFDGASCVFGHDGQVQARAKSFAEDMLVYDIESDQPGRIEPLEPEIARLSAALKLGLGDYVTKCGFSSVVLGLSGGIDSAVVATLAADAVGPENVLGIAMPSRYSSEHSIKDAKDLAENLGIGWQVFQIEPIHAAYEQALAGALDGPGAEVAEENIQARIRGNLVMAMSNAQGYLPLATGNKSELSVGYCTLYGDMSGGFAPIGDVLKTVTYRLAGQLNDEVGSSRIPESTITKPPSAELKPDQVDQDKLPPYEILDEILRGYVEQDLTADTLIKQGFDAATVLRIVRMVDLAEYKRKQAAPVLKVTPRAFGSGRRMPIAQRFGRQEPNL
ncbi:MAG: NAD+ synthase [Phycisphaerae bacterium]